MLTITRALEMEGTCTGEHGVGLVKKDVSCSSLGVDVYINVLTALSLVSSEGAWTRDNQYYENNKKSSGSS